MLDHISSIGGKLALSFNIYVHTLGIIFVMGSRGRHLARQVLPGIASTTHAVSTESSQHKVINKSNGANLVFLLPFITLLLSAFDLPLKVLRLYIDLS